MFYDRIVAVDDDLRALEALRLALQKQYRVVCFNGGEAALDYLRKPNSISLVFVDVVMKGMDGISVLHEIKKINKDIKVVVMSAFGSREVVLKALQHHADDFIDKPFDLAELKDKVDRLINKRTGSASHARIPDRMKDFVAQNLSDVSLQDVAEEACLSPKYVSRLFKQQNDCGFRDFKIRSRIEKAKELLQKTEYPVYKIAQELGYQNSETFMRLFKRKTGMRPLEYRQSHQQRSDAE